MLEKVQLFKMQGYNFLFLMLMLFSLAKQTPKCLKYMQFQMMFKLLQKNYMYIISFFPFT